MNNSRERPYREVHRSRDAEGACRACAEYLAEVLRIALAGAPTASLAVSGGRTPATMFGLLAEMALDWGRVHLFWVDERAVPPGDGQSNFGMAVRHLAGPAGIPEANLHRIAGEISPHEAARRYEHGIRAHFGCGTEGMPRFDAVQLGVGDDGHTASLFPGDPLIENREGIAAATYSSKAEQWRVTLLPGAILAARNIAVLVCGESKAEALKRAWEGAYNPMGCPAQILTREASQARWFLDETVAARLVS